MMGKKPNLTYLIDAAFALVEGWEGKRVTRSKWQKADELLMQAALLDETGAEGAWERLAVQYEGWLALQGGKKAA